MNSLEYHVLLALAVGPLHGYAVKQRVETESGGSLTPQPGSLYRVIARLTTSRLPRGRTAGCPPSHTP